MQVVKLLATRSLSRLAVADYTSPSRQVIGVLSRSSVMQLLVPLRPHLGPVASTPLTTLLGSTSNPLVKMTDTVLQATTTMLDTGACGVIVTDEAGRYVTVLQQPLFEQFALAPLSVLPTRMSQLIAEFMRAQTPSTPIALRACDSMATLIEIMVSTSARCVPVVDAAAHPIGLLDSLCVFEYLSTVLF